jgi:hypothetical protein
VTEAEARDALRAFVPMNSSIECRIADLPWQPAADGWVVLGDVCGLRFRLAHAPGGLRVVARHSDGNEPYWFVPAAPQCAG